VSFLNTLRGAFVDDVPDAAPVEAAPAKTARGSQPSPPPAAPAAPSAVADPAALAKLEGRLQGAIPPIYAAFMDAMGQLSDVIPDEAMRFKAALKMSKAASADLIAALDAMSAEMNVALKEFDAKFDAQKAKVEGAANESIAATEALIQSRASQLKAIEDEIVSLNSKLQVDQEKLRSEQARLMGISAGFDAAHATIVARLQTQKTGIASMPKG
jgi:hypothetical protein